MPSTPKKNLLQGPLHKGSNPFLSSPQGRSVAMQRPLEKILYPHQQKLLDETWDKPGFAIFWEMRTGKTPFAISTATKLHQANKIEAVILLAPNPLHLSWSRQEVPQWAPNSTIYEWISSKPQFPPLDTVPKNLIWFTINLEALQVQGLAEYIFQFVKKFKTLLIVDESHSIKSSRYKRTHGSKKPRSRIVRELSVFCPFRRILSGTPFPNSIFDAWSQFYVVLPTVLGRSSTAFKQHYGVFETKHFSRVPIVTGYQNQEELSKIIAPYTSWLKLDEVLKDLPETTHQKIYFELSPKIKKPYQQLEKEFFLYLKGEQVIVEHALTRLLRLQQLSRGFFQDVWVDPKPALEALRIPPNEKTIIFCHFKAELSLLNTLPNPHITVSAETPQAERLKLIKQFNEDKSIQLFISTPAISGQGISLASARNIIFFSNSYNMAQRTQALARITGHAQQAKHLFIYDLVAANTVDEKILEALEEKKTISEILRKGEL